MINSLNLSLSTNCTADCIFCPSDRGECIPEKTMTVATAFKIINEVATPEFQERFKTQEVVVGENGDLFLNPNWLDILRHIKRKLPKVKVSIQTNFLLLTSDKAKTILEEDLVSQVSCNIDSLDPKAYELAKRIPFEPVWNNFTEFQRLREETGSKTVLVVNILNPFYYTFHIGYFYLTRPKKGSPCGYNDGKETHDKLFNEILRKDDIVNTLTPCGWAERGRGVVDDIPAEFNKCPYISRIENEAFFAPDGTWYACCLDSKCELQIGNVYEQSITEIHDGQDRKDLLEKLRSDDVRTAGGPCKDVKYCYCLKLI